MLGAHLLSRESILNRSLILNQIMTPGIKFQMIVASSQRYIGEARHLVAAAQTNDLSQA